MSSPTVIFHTLVTGEFDTAYYSAVASPRPGDSAIVLNFEKQNPADPKVKKNIIQPLFIRNGLGNTPSDENTTIVDKVTSLDPDICSKECLSRISSVFVTCTISPFHIESSDPCIQTSCDVFGQAIIKGIAQQSLESFPNMNIERSFFKVQLGDKSYDATSELNLNSLTSPNLHLFPLPRN